MTERDSSSPDLKQQMQDLYNGVAALGEDLVPKPPASQEEETLPSGAKVPKLSDAQPEYMLPNTVNGPAVWNQSFASAIRLGIRTTSTITVAYAPPCQVRDSLEGGEYVYHPGSVSFMIEEPEQVGAPIDPDEALLENAGHRMYQILLDNRTDPPKVRGELSFVTEDETRGSAKPLTRDEGEAIKFETMFDEEGLTLSGTRRIFDDLERRGSALDQQQLSDLAAVFSLYPRD